MRIKICGLAAIVALVGLSGCLSNGESDTGNLSLYITDAPVDGAKRVVVQISGVDVHRSKGTEYFTFPTPKQIDLLANSGGIAAYLLEFVSLPAGEYQWIRLRIDAVPNVEDTYIELNDGSHHELSFETNDALAYKITHNVSVPVDGTVDLTIDLDLRRSLYQDDSGYILKPVVTVVENKRTGNISGSVDSTLLTATGCESGAAVYLFSGADALPVDFNVNSRGEPLNSALVRYDPTTSTDTIDVYRYTVGFLPAATYTVALTCDADIDAIDQDDLIGILAQGNVVVEDNRRTAYYSFLPE